MGTGAAVAAIAGVLATKRASSSAVVAILLASVACGPEDGLPELAPVAELPWPELSLPPTCEPWRGTFALPPLAPPEGDLRFEVGTSLQPAGVEVRVDVSVLYPGTSDIDEDAAGELVIDVAEAAEVVASAPVVSGRSVVVLVFAEPGVHHVAASLVGDERTGSVEIEAYTTQLPIWELEIDEGDLAELLANFQQRIRVDAAVSVDGGTRSGSVRIHGGSSRQFPKKSLRLDLDSPLDDGQAAIILRAEYNDKTMLRTWLGYEMFRQGSWIPTPASELVHLRVNRRYYGLMHRVQRIDGAFLAASGLDPAGNLYEADPPQGLSAPGGNLTPLPEDTDYFLVYQWHAGRGAWEDLIELIEVYLQLASEDFAVLADSVVKLDEYLAYLALMAAMQNHEHVRKNYYLYHDPEGPDPRWLQLPWDLDLTFGHLWSEARDVLDERIVTDGDLFVGVRAPERFGYFNQMTDQVLSVPAYRRRFLEILSHLQETVFRREFVDPWIAHLTCLIEPDLVADRSKWAEDDEYLERVGELGTFIDARRDYIADVLEREGLGAER